MSLRSFCRGQAVYRPTAQQNALFLGITQIVVGEGCGAYIGRWVGCEITIQGQIPPLAHRNFISETVNHYHYAKRCELLQRVTNFSQRFEEFYNVLWRYVMALMIIYATANHNRAYSDICSPRYSASSKLFDDLLQEVGHNHDNVLPSFHLIECDHNAS